MDFIRVIVPASIVAYVFYVINTIIDTLREINQRLISVESSLNQVTTTLGTLKDSDQVILPITTNLEFIRDNLLQVLIATDHIEAFMK